MVTIPLETGIKIGESGNCVKLPSGFMVQWGICAAPITEKGQTIGSIQIVLPVSFIDDDLYIGLTNMYTSTDKAIWTPTGVSKSGFNAHFYTTETSLGTNSNMKARWLAIGRWK